MTLAPSHRTARHTARVTRLAHVLPVLAVLLLVVAIGVASAAPPVYVRSSGATGASVSFDIGSAGTDRLVMVLADDESAGATLTGVTVDGNSCNLVTRADHASGLGNHQELWYCDEDELGASSGTVTVAIAGGDAGWGVHAHLYTGVSQTGPTDFGVDQSSASTTTVSVAGIDVPADGLVVMAARGESPASHRERRCGRRTRRAEGKYRQYSTDEQRRSADCSAARMQRDFHHGLMGAAEGTGGLTVSSWTSPLTQRQNGPHPSSADLLNASGAEVGAQTNKTYTATFSGTFNRGTAIVAVWPDASVVPPAPFVGSGGGTGTSFSFDIGLPGTNRVVAVFADDESEGTNLSGVTVAGHACHAVVRAENTAGAGNHQELWYCDEDDLAGAAGIVTVALIGADAGWGMHAHLYRGAGQDGPTDVGVDQSSARRAAGRSRGHGGGRRDGRPHRHELVRSDLRAAGRPRPRERRSPDCQRRRDDRADEQDPTPVQLGLLTAVELIAFTATGYDRGVLLAWETGYEIDNLGFHLYREQAGERVRLTESLIAGSGLQAGQGAGVTAELNYAFWDMEVTQAPPGTRYWLEDVEFDGTSTLHGPVTPVNGGHLIDVGPPAPGEGVRGEDSGSLDTLGRKTRSRQRRFFTGEDPPEARSRRDRSDRVDPQRTQWQLAGQDAIKIGVRPSGWYRVTQPELVAAGLDPDVNPRRLRLYVEGVEQAIVVAGEQDGRLDVEDALEFYGMGDDTPYTDTRIYWLVTGNGRGLRVGGSAGRGRAGRRDSGTATGPGLVSRSGRARRSDTEPSSFRATVQQKDRSIYFAALENGDTENWFGQLVGSSPSEVALSLGNPDPAAPGPASLEVALQGVTTDPDIDPDHRVTVSFNGVAVGELVFDGRHRHLQRFLVPHRLLREGANTVGLTSGGDTDVSLIDSVSVSYWHTYRADADRLRFTVAGPGVVQVAGFASGAIRVMDITDPAAPREVRGRVRPEHGLWTFVAQIRGPGPRTLLAFTEATVAAPASVGPNQRSRWHAADTRYDYLVVTDALFAESFEPLLALRTAEGHRAALVRIDDVYDEFSFGQKTPQALKDFLARARTSWAQPPAFVVLAGDATQDPRDYAGFGDADFVPTKLVAMDTIELESASDEWFADIDDDGTSELAIGRLPMRTVAQADTMVDKLVGYAVAAGGPWTKRTLLLADEAEPEWTFADTATQVEASLPSGFSAHQIRVDDVGAGPARAELLAQVGEGHLLVDFLGHGSNFVWGKHGTLLTTADVVDTWRAGARLPVVVAMNCLNGFFHGIYGEESLAETLLRAPEGAVAAWASSSLTFAAPQAAASQAFFDLVLSGQFASIGEAVVAAKHTVADRDVRRSWIFFGDPAMRLKDVPPPAAIEPGELTASTDARPPAATRDRTDRADAAGTSSATTEPVTRYLADFDGDGRADPFLYAPETGAWSLAVSGTRGFQYLTGQWAPHAELFAADLNDDSLADLFGYDVDTGRWSQSLHHGDGTFATFSGSWAPGWSVAFGDLDGDGRDDLFLSNPETGTWVQALTDGAGGFTYRGGGALPEGDVYLVDVNGDRRADVFVYDPERGRWSVGVFARTGAISFVSSVSFPDRDGPPQWVVHPANLDANDWADLLFFDRASGAWFEWRTDTDGRVTFAGGGASSGGGALAVADLDGDGRDDVVRYDAATGQWVSSLTRRFGGHVDLAGTWPKGRSLAVGDLNGDQTDDLLLYDPDTGAWTRMLARLSSGGSVVFTEAHGGWSGAWTVVGRRQKP